MWMNEANEMKNEIKQMNSSKNQKWNQFQIEHANYICIILYTKCERDREKTGVFNIQ